MVVGSLEADKCRVFACAGGTGGVVASWGEMKSDSVLAHFVHVPGGATNKLTVKMANGR